MGKIELLDYLKKNNGKSENETWIDIAKKFDISINSKYPKDSQDYNNSLGDTIRVMWKKESLKPQPSGPYQNLKLKKAWEVQKKGGIIETLHSYEATNNLSPEDLEKIYDSFRLSIKDITPFEPVQIAPNSKFRSIILPISDIHIGAIGGSLMVENKYNAEIVKERFNKVFQSLLNDFNIYGAFDRIVIIDLGDSVDGHNGKTTRGGHDLDQNMNSREQFDTYFDGFKTLFDSIHACGLANYVDFIGMANDNHGGTASYTAQRGLEIYLNAKYPKMKTLVTNDFITYFDYGKHTYMLTHGKDEKHMKHGLPLIMDIKTELYLQRFIDAKKLKGDFIHLVKGDLHQLSDQQGYKIRYKSTLSFFGGTEWIHTNFGPNRPGVSYDIIEPSNREITKKEIYFD